MAPTSEIAKIGALMGGKTTPLEKVSLAKQPVVTKVGEHNKLVCQFSGLLCEKLYNAKTKTKMSGWVVTEALATNIFESLNSETPEQVLSKTLAEVMEAEAKKKLAATKKDMSYFKVNGTNVEKFHALNDWDAVRKMMAEGPSSVQFLNLAGKGELIVFTQCKVRDDVWEKVLMYDGKYEDKPPKLPSLSKPAIIMARNKVVQQYPRLKMLLNEHKGKMPVMASKTDKAKAAIAQEQEEEKIVRKHSNRKLGAKFKDAPGKKKDYTPKRLRDIAGPTPAKKQKVEAPVKAEPLSDEEGDFDPDAIGCESI